MPIQYTDQLNLLKDILQDHLEDCCGTVSELEQIERLVKQLMMNHQVDPEIQAILEDIYYYGQKGKYSSDLDNHISTYQNQLSNWVDSIDQLSFE